MDEEESFFDLVTRFQSKRMDDQRCSLAVVDNKENQQASTLPANVHGEFVEYSFPLRCVCHWKGLNQHTCLQ